MMSNEQVLQAYQSRGFKVNNKKITLRQLQEWTRKATQQTMRQ